MKVDIYVDGATLCNLDLSPEALDAVRLKFNPSGIQHVNALKVAAAALYQLNMNTQENTPEAVDEVYTAKVNVQTASMWSVLAATKGL
jgi:hypothetical protein